MPTSCNWVVAGVFVFWAGMLVAMAGNAMTNHYSLGLYEDAAVKSPGEYRAQLNCAAAYMDRHDYAFALGYALRAARLRADRASCWLNASSAAAGLRAYHLAHECLERAFALYPARQVAENLIYTAKVLGREAEVREYTQMLDDLSMDLPLNEPRQ